VAYALSKNAEDDIIEIYINGASRFGIEQANHYHEHIEKMFELLAEHPYMARERFEISPPVRIHPFQSHLIVYTVDEQGHLFIIRIRHAHEDWHGSK